MKRALTWLSLLGVIGLAAALWLTRPAVVDPERIASLQGDAARGEAVFWAGGCASCHKAESGDDDLALPGGRRFTTRFGTFVAPNISSHPTHGIGGWSVFDFASALLHGTSPEGRHYYPAFPYTSYTRMNDQDVADLWAFMQTLPASPVASLPHELEFPFNVRAPLGAWKALFLTSAWVRPAETPEQERGRYLVEALGHCAECHTPRNFLGGSVASAWMEGAPHPAGRGRIPGLVPSALDWSEEDIAYYLETGFTPDFDSAGGEMAEVVATIGRLAPEDRVAIAKYIKALE
ncbi:MAG: c-type cytochrome [Boseongicola sp. SB0664_bin_43]|uniref:C-type cytochrome n=1 Tax=Boseongicola sp. SB0664_bin_43 TaxID=2604844 RepID=A0A6B0XYL4_9RHOB|nr:c-type cytochrome [Boseongicola sp. SB0664_bin_43]